MKFGCIGLVNAIVLPDSCTSSGVVALTIDEGPTAYTDEIIDILKKKGVVATFHFNPSITGAEYQDIYDRAEDEGHEIGMRTSPKRSYTDEMAYSEVEDDLNQQLNFLQSRTSNKIKYARSPRNGDLPVENVYNYFTKKSLVQSSYSINPQEDPSVDPVDRIKEFLGPNNYKYDSFIIQLFEQRLQEDRNLEEIIDAIAENNYKFVVMSECLDGYKPGEPVNRRTRSKNSKSSAKSIIMPTYIIPIAMYFLC